MARLKKKSQTERIAIELNGTGELPDCDCDLADGGYRPRRDLIKAHTAEYSGFASSAPYRVVAEVCYERTGNPRSPQAR